MVIGVSTLLHLQRFLLASCWEYAAKHNDKKKKGEINPTTVAKLSSDILHEGFELIKGYLLYICISSMCGS